jgi:hypothetical protein
MIANKTAGGRLEGLLGDWRVGYAAATPGADSARYNPMRPLTVAEEEGFLRAYEGRDRVVEVDGTGRCTFPGFRTSGSYGLFYRDSTRSSDPTILLWREFLTQAAAAAELVRKYKWPRRLLGVEVDNRDDVVVFDRAGAPIVVVEAKEVVGGRNGLEGLLQYFVPQPTGEEVPAAPGDEAAMVLGGGSGGPGRLRGDVRQERGEAPQARATRSVQVAYPEKRTVVRRLNGPSAQRPRQHCLGVHERR